MANQSTCPCFVSEALSCVAALNAKENKFHLYPNRNDGQHKPTPPSSGFIEASFFSDLYALQNSKTDIMSANYFN